MAIQAICAFCSHEFSHRPSHPQTYCSKECAYQAREAGKYETISCATCNKPVRSLKSWPRRYCSRACSGKGNTWNQREVATGRVTLNCQQCGKQFSAVRSAEARFCSIPCKCHWAAVHLVGENHWRTGQKPGRSKHLPPPLVKQCEVCGKEFVKAPGLAPRYFCCSRACGAIRFGRLHSGENHYHWKGGRPSYYGPNWNSQRRKARARDKVCQDCGKTPQEHGRALCVHHLRRFGDFGLERYLEANDLSNLITLCCTCHPRWDRRDNPPARRSQR